MWALMETRAHGSPRGQTEHAAAVQASDGACAQTSFLSHHFFKIETHPIFLILIDTRAQARNSECLPARPTHQEELLYPLAQTREQVCRTGYWRHLVGGEGLTGNRVPKGGCSP